MNILRRAPSAYIDDLTLPELNVELVLAASRLLGTRVVPSGLTDGFLVCRECAGRGRDRSAVQHREDCPAGMVAHLLLAIARAEAERVSPTPSRKESLTQENRRCEPAETAAQEKRPFLLHEYVMSPAEREEQRRSFAHGNVAMHNGDVTREVIDRAADALASQYHEPWTLSPDGEVLDAEGHVMVDPQGCSLPEVGALLVMRRIVAAVNHCQGVLTTELCRETERAAAGGGR